jgi:TRAP-type uncharacterized transport system fused permease subunit
MQCVSVSCNHLATYAQLHGVLQLVNSSLTIALHCTALLLLCQQNLGEAEYVVACYQYMRLLGYPAEKIAILTTYNGQRALIGDVLQQVCMHALLYIVLHWMDTSQYTAIPHCTPHNVGSVVLLLCMHAARESMRYYTVLHTL